MYAKIIARQRWDVFSRHSVEWHGRRVNYRRPIKSASLYTDLHVARLSHSQQVPTDSPKRRRFVKIRRQVADEYTKPAALVTGQPADTPTRGLPTRGLDDSRTGHLADWTTRVLDKSRTGQLADAMGDFACLSFPFWRHPRETASCPVRELAYPRVVQLPRRYQCVETPRRVIIRCRVER